MSCRWFERPEGAAISLRQAPRLASWNKSTDRDQVRLREYLADTKDLVAESLIGSPWTLRLDVGLPAGRDLVDMADLDNYALPLAAALRDDNLVSVWCTKRHAATSTIRMAPAHEVTPPPELFAVRTTASSESTAYKEQVRFAVAGVPELPPGPVWLQLGFKVGPRRNWLNLWKPTIDALDPLLGKTRADRNWHPKDGRITELGLHLTTDLTLGNDVIVSIAAGPAVSTSTQGSGAIGPPGPYSR